MEAQHLTPKHGRKNDNLPGELHPAFSKKVARSEFLGSECDRNQLWRPDTRHWSNQCQRRSALLARWVPAFWHRIVSKARFSRFRLVPECRLEWACFRGRPKKKHLLKITGIVSNWSKTQCPVMQKKYYLARLHHRWNLGSRKSEHRQHKCGPSSPCGCQTERSSAVVVDNRSLSVFWLHPTRPFKPTGTAFNDDPKW